MSKAFGVTYLEPDHGITERVHGLARQLDLPPPIVGIMSAANAFAVGSDPNDSAVVLGQPLISRLSDDELDAVIGHELGHIAYGDMQSMQRTMGYQRMFVGLTSLTVFLAFQLGARTRQGAYLGYLYGRLLRHTLFFLTELALKGLSRRREYYADAVGAILTSPQAMQGALNKIHTMGGEPVKEEKRFGHLMFRGRARGHPFATHPSLQERCRALQTEEYIRKTLRKAALSSAMGLSSKPVAAASDFIPGAHRAPSYALDDEFFVDEEKVDVAPPRRPLQTRIGEMFASAIDAVNAAVSGTSATYVFEKTREWFERATEMLAGTAAGLAPVPGKIAAYALTAFYAVKDRLPGFPSLTRMLKLTVGALGLVAASVGAVLLWHAARDSHVALDSWKVPEPQPFRKFMGGGEIIVSKTSVPQPEPPRKNARKKQAKPKPETASTNAHPNPKAPATTKLP